MAEVIGLRMGHDQEEMEEGVGLVPGNLRKLLGVTVRSVQWSYAIFWSMSKTQQGVLEWGEGYYNGDIKTRKISQAMEVLEADKMGLLRSKQLRELYESLLEGENCEEEQQATRPSDAPLCPEDLSDAEWFYMVCMSFQFNPGQGLPGRALANGQTIWLCNAQYADSKVFSRSLLAKSASIQTVLCFPYLGGVMELGTTELVAEDPALIQHVKTSLLDLLKPDCYVKHTFESYSTDSDEDPTCVNAGYDGGKMKTLQNDQSGAGNIKAEDEEMRRDGPSKDSDEELGVSSPDCSSDTIELNLQSQVHSWHFTDGDFGTDLHGSMNFSDCASQVVESPSDTKISKPKFGPPNVQKSLQENNHIKPRAQANGSSVDLRYRRVISTILSNSNGSFGCNGCACRSSFRAWKKLGVVASGRPLKQQRILKKMLFTVPPKYSQRFIKPEIKQIGKKASNKPNDDIPQVLENEIFSTLRSMIPSAGADKASVLEETIRYVQELEARLGELESSVDVSDPKWEPGKVHLVDTAEQVSDNSEFERKTLKQKRKANERESVSALMNSSMKVVMMEQEVVIEVTCRWREYLLLDIMEAVNRLQLDAHSVQSAVHDGVFTLKLNSKFRGTAMVAPARVVKQVIWESICHEEELHMGF